MNCHCCDYNYIREDALLFCSRCGHRFRDFEGDPIAYHANQYRRDIRFWRNKTEFDEAGRPTKAFHKARAQIVKKRWKKIRSYLQPEDVCLDVGSGAGTFARQIQRHVSRVDCLELDPVLIEESQRMGFHTLHSDFLSSDFTREYDVVFAWHVLEHVPDPVPFAQRALSLANKYVIFEVPVNRRVPEQFDGHYHYFSEVSFRLVFGAPRVIAMEDGVQKPALLAVVDAA